VSLVEPAEPVPLADLGRVHFVGIGGTGMSGVARVMLARGVKVSGSDTVPGEAFAELARLGADVYAGHSPAHLDGVDTVVVSTAIRPGNVEVAEARRRGLRVLHRAGALASLMHGRRAVAVTGTHGKTTTTSMLVTVLRLAGADPGYVIGGILNATGVSAGDGNGELFVAEADESDGSFLHLAPELAIVTCVDADHLDNYRDLAEIREVFARFAGRVRPGGALVLCADDPGAAALAAPARAAGLRVRQYGESAGADYRVTAIRAAGMAVSCWVSAGPGAAPGAPRTVRLELGVPGRHNALNAAAAYAAALEMGVAAGAAARGLAGYRGVRRRLEPRGEAAGVLVLDSYAHHPAELRADLAAARAIRPGARVIAVFQPHLYSRTRIFAEQFGEALALADEILVLDVYGAREDPEPGVSGRLVSDAVPGGRGRFVAGRTELPGLAAAAARPGDLVLTMGAGDVTELGPLIVAELAAREGR
jgi:UDP-N-acetylmuramate--alanine ligase